MKPCVLFVFLLLFSVACDKDENYYEQVEIGSFITKNYFDDAVELYLREIVSDKKHPNYHWAELDEDELNRILNIFQLVLDLNSSESAAVFEVNSIHALKCIGTKSIAMQVDTNSTEAIHLANQDFPTGNDVLDALLNEYTFDSVRVSYSYPRFPWLSVHTKNTYNLIPIIEEFEQLPFVEIAVNNGGCFDGNNITLERDSGKSRIDFSVGSGDCPAGCIHRKHWVFEIQGGKARFVGTFED